MENDIWQSCMGNFSLGLSEAACASWVQAWGTILTIVATAWIAGAASRKMRKDASAEYTRHLEVLFQLSGAVLKVLKKIQECESSEFKTTPSDYDSMTAELSSLGHAFRAYEVGKLDRYNYIALWSLADSTVRHLLVAVAHVNSPKFAPQLERLYLRNLAAEHFDALELPVKKLHDDIEQRGRAPIDVSK